MIFDFIFTGQSYVDYKLYLVFLAIPKLLPSFKVFFVRTNWFRFVVTPYNRNV